MEKLLLGSAYYDEYMPYERVEKDAEMMNQAGFNVVRIAESTWSTCEPQEGVFDFSHVIHVMDVMEAHGISVIIGTPTYAVPSWLAKKHPDVLAETFSGRERYGRRQNMDITNPHYRFYAERIIRKLMETVSRRKCVIGYQIDNETKYYGVAGVAVQKGFLEYLKKKFSGSCEAMNRAFGLDYWSNRVESWEDFPDIRGTINGSLAAEFDRYRRSLVTEFLRWQAELVSEYKRDGQFITNNMDFEWRDHSFGVQPECDHNRLAEHLTIAACDIYHPSEDELTGEEIAFGGDLTRSLKKDNYLVMETQAQGYPCWTPYPGQLRLQAYSHIASGANMVSYWPWHSIHNSFETYWRGVLSHDMAENAVYREASAVGNEWRRFGSRLADLKKENRIAMLVSNSALTAVSCFGIHATNGDRGNIFYNDVVRGIYDRMFHLNMECDIIWKNDPDLEKYDLLAVPALYSAPEATLLRLSEYVRNGGVLVTTFKTGFADENVKVYPDTQPHILHECAGVSYQQFFYPDRESRAEFFAELLMPEEGTEVLMRYENPAWKEYAAVTAHAYGKGYVFYLGCMPDPEILDRILLLAAEKAGIPKVSGFAPAGEMSGAERLRHTVAVRKGTNRYGRTVVFYLNYSGSVQNGRHIGKDAVSLLDGRRVLKDGRITLPPWGLEILEEDG